MMRRLLKPLAALAVTFAFFAGMESLFATMAARPMDKIPDLNAACKTDNPYLASPCYRGIVKDAIDATFKEQAPSLIMFNDTPNDKPEYQLADFQQIGTTWGLAYNPNEPAIYAASYAKRQLPFGPGGPGAIYRVDLKTLKTTTFATIPNVGKDPHQSRMDLPDAKMIPAIGRMALGDLDFNRDRTEMYVMNLLEKKVYRLSFPGGQVLGSFDNGAVGEPWADDARPFALAYHNGLLYHGVVNSAQSTNKDANIEAYVYESDPDGGNMRQVAKVPLTYARGTIKLGPGSRQVNVKWKAWTDMDPPEPRGDFLYATNPQPMLTDIEFDADNAMILGFRDRLIDSTAAYLIYTYRVAREEHLGMGVGDILRGTYNGSTWDVQTTPEYYNDDAAFLGAESATGGLAFIPWTNEAVSSAIGIQDPQGYQEAPAEGFVWFKNTSGDKTRKEKACSMTYMRPLDTGNKLQSFMGLKLAKLAFAGDGEIPPPPPTPTIQPTNRVPAPVRGPGSTGDVELLCPLDVPVPPTNTPEGVITDTPTPTPTPTDTPPPPTPTDTPTNTPTPTDTPTPTPTPTPKPGPIYLPILIKDKQCQDGFKYTDVALVVDSSSSMLRTDESGHMKFTAAKTAAHLFVKLLQLPNDQVAVVQFNNDAKMVLTLTGDRATADAAIDSISTALHTRIDLGIAMGHEELKSVRHVEGHNQTLVLLTDGIPDGTTREEVLAKAAAAKADGIRIFTIGLGKEGDLDLPLLQDSASALNDFYRAPTGDDLDAIYRQIAYALILCRPEMYWPYLPNPGAGASQRSAR